jgi:hypothetical protein
MAEFTKTFKSLEDFKNYINENFKHSFQIFPSEQNRHNGLNDTGEDKSKRIKAVS